MSNVAITDRKGGVFQVVMTFTYGECERLPYNQLRKVGARIEQVPNGGIKATAEFNVRDAKSAGRLIDTLALFGEDGSYQHGSGVDGKQLGKATPEEEDVPGRGGAAAGSARRPVSGTAAAVPSPESGSAAAKPGKEAGEDLEVEEEEPALEEVEGETGLEVEELPVWRVKGADAVRTSFALNEPRPKTLKRVETAAGVKFDEALTRRCLLAILAEKYRDPAFVLTEMNRRGWKELSAEEIAALKRGEKLWP